MELPELQSSGNQSKWEITSLKIFIGKIKSTSRHTLRLRKQFRQPPNEKLVKQNLSEKRLVSVAEIYPNDSIHLNELIPLSFSITNSLTSMGHLPKCCKLHLWRMLENIGSLKLLIEECEQSTLKEENGINPSINHKTTVALHIKKNFLIYGSPTRDQQVFSNLQWVTADSLSPGFCNLCLLVHQNKSFTKLVWCIFY